MVKVLLSFFVYTLCWFSDAKEIAITFDDSPRSATGFLSGPERAKRLNEALNKVGVEQVAFFSVSKDINKEGKKRLEAYASAGHLIANHSHTHPNFNEVSLSEYSENFKTAHTKLSNFNNFKKWYRFPFLREGNTAEKRDGFRGVLKKDGYFNAYITMNNYDWYIETLFQKAVAEGHKIDMEKMKTFYVNTLLESIDYYDGMAVKHLKRSPKHVLLLHEMDISALFIGDLVLSLKKRGWKIISPTEAYQDPIAGYKTDRVMKFNPGRVAEIARDKGQTKGLWHKSCDEAYLEKKFKSEVL